MYEIRLCAIELCAIYFYVLNVLGVIIFQDFLENSVLIEYIARMYTKIRVQS